MKTAHFLTFTREHGLQSAGPIPVADYPEFEEIRTNLVSAISLEMPRRANTIYLCATYRDDGQP